MATTTVYITVRLDVENNKIENFTDELIQELVSTIDYQFNDCGDYTVTSEICGIND